MKVADILKTKGAAVKTVNPNETAKTFAEQLKGERIGAMIVSLDGSLIEGIISERDLAYGLAAYGDKLAPNPHTMFLDDAAISKSRLSTAIGVSRNQPD
jgi:CBS domain-containing protein